MGMLIVLLVVFGLILSIVTVVIVYYLWSYSRLKKQHSKEDDKNLPLKNFPYSTQLPKLPIFTKTVTQQIPSNKHQLPRKCKSSVDLQVFPVFQKKEIFQRNGKTEEHKSLNTNLDTTRRLSQSVEDLRAAERKNSEVMSAALIRKKFGTIPKQMSHDSDGSSQDTRLFMTKQMVINKRMMNDLRQKHSESKTSRRRSSQLPGSEKMIQKVLSAGSSLDYYEDSDTGSVYSGFSPSDNELNLDDSFNSGSLSRRRLAMRRGSNLAAKPIYRKGGKIIFSTEYNEDQQIFRVHIQQVLNLAPKREESDISSFVRLYLEPGKKQKQVTRTIRGNKDPVFEEMFKFVNVESSELGHHKVKFKVYNSARLKNELLGEATLFLSSLDITMKETFQLDLLLRKSEICKASVIVSLCHQGTFSKLEVIIHEAKKLPKRHNTPNLNPYVVVSLYKDDTIETKETVYQMNDRNPIFNESFDFTVQTDHATPLSTYSLVVSIVHKSFVRKDWTIGHVIYSLSSPQTSAKEQWRTVQAEPHRRHTETHFLLDPNDL